MEVKRQFTWTEYLDEADKQLPGHPCHRDGRGHSRPGFNGSVTYAQAQKMGRGEGYKAVVAKAETLADQVSTIVAETLQETFQASWDVSGAEVDMGRYLAGVPECMVESQPIKIARAGRAVRICVPVGCSAAVTDTTMQNRGAAIIALIFALQRLKHPLEVWAGAAVSRREDRICDMVEVQRADQPLDIGRVMFALAHPACFRHLAFNAFDNVEDEGLRRRLSIVRNGSYGSAPYGLQDDDLPDQPGTTIVLPELRSSDQWDVAYSVNWIERQLALIFEEK